MSRRVEGLNQARYERTENLRQFVSKIIFLRTGQTVDPKEITNTFPKHGPWRVILLNEGIEYPQETISQLSASDGKIVKTALEDENATAIKWIGESSSHKRQSQKKQSRARTSRSRSIAPTHLTPASVESDTSPMDTSSSASNPPLTVPPISIDASPRITTPRSRALDTQLVSSHSTDEYSVNLSLEVVRRIPYVKDLIAENETLKIQCKNFQKRKEQIKAAMQETMTLVP